MLYVNFVNVLITKDVFLVMLMTINGCVSIVLVVYFRLIIILMTMSSDIHFIIFITLLNITVYWVWNWIHSSLMKFINGNTANDLVNPPSDNSSTYMFDCSLDDIDVSFKNGFSILHLNSRSFNRNHDNIEVFLSNIEYNFSLIAMSETWFKQDNSFFQDNSWEHAWSSGKAQDSWSLDHHECCEFEPRYDQGVCVPGQDT